MRARFAAFAAGRATPSKWSTISARSVAPFQRPMTQAEHVAASGREPGDGLVQEHGLLLAGEEIADVGRVGGDGAGHLAGDVENGRGLAPADEVERLVAGDREQGGFGGAQLSAGVQAEDPDVGFLDDVVDIGDRGEAGPQVVAQGGFVAPDFSFEPAVQVSCSFGTVRGRKGGFIGGR
jgi:hypothetical protein